MAKTRVSITRVRFSWDIHELDRTEDELFRRKYRCANCGRRHDLNIDIHGNVWCGDCRQPSPPYLILNGVRK